MLTKGLFVALWICPGTVIGAPISGNLQEDEEASEGKTPSLRGGKMLRGLYELDVVRSEPDVLLSEHDEVLLEETSVEDMPHGYTSYGFQEPPVAPMSDPSDVGLTEALASYVPPLYPKFGKYGSLGNGNFKKGKTSFGNSYSTSFYYPFKGKTALGGIPCGYAGCVDVSKRHGSSSFGSGSGYRSKKGRSTFGGYGSSPYGSPKKGQSSFSGYGSSSYGPTKKSGSYDSSSYGSPKKNHSGYGSFSSYGSSSYGSPKKGYSSFGGYGSSSYGSPKKSHSGYGSFSSSYGSSKTSHSGYDSSGYGSPKKSHSGYDSFSPPGYGSFSSSGYGSPKKRSSSGYNSHPSYTSSSSYSSTYGSPYGSWEEGAVPEGAWT